MEIYISEPWESTVTRKGDPLGFQDVANLIADEISPGLSGRNKDARWLTLLCKGLTGLSPNMLNEDDPYHRIALWERAIIVYALEDNPQDKSRQLPGKSKARSDWPVRYRYYGPYGSYKKLMIRIGLLDKDGYRLTGEGKRLAAVIGNDLITNIKSNITDMKKICAATPEKTKKWLPTYAHSKLENDEKEILSKCIFGSDDEGTIRKQTFKWMKSEYFWENKIHGIPGVFCEAFDEFTRCCFIAIQEISSTLNIANSSVINAPKCWKDVTKSAKNIESIANKTNVHDTAQKVLALAKQLLTGTPQILVDHHINVAINGKKWIGKYDGKYSSLVGENEKIRTAYNFRLYNIWRLGNQLVPDYGPSKYPWGNADVYEEEAD